MYINIPQYYMMYCNTCLPYAENTVFSYVIFLRDIREMVHQGKVPLRR